ncbi:MAG: sigma 54-interacting transcriptional regulator [Myxococcota bacterium]|nr:sigma 54-interacting transcriptional regulator [Myxococcota bacterium]
MAADEDNHSTAAVSGRETAPMIDRIDLAVIGGPDAGKVIRATNKRVVIGTGEGADLLLGDTTVSRFHCEIVLEDGKAIARDLGSKNGTLVDGVNVLVAPLRDGCVLTFGKSTVRFAREVGALRPLVSTRDRFGVLVGRSLAMRSVYEVLERAAATDVTVLLRGETGTGKDLAAASIHQESPRSEGPFVVMDLAAAPGPLLASELFGHERGAFTGADRERAGVFERAQGGTVFLDEIGDLDLDLQPHLLRVLESRTVQRVGGSARIPVDVRVIAATHRDLRADVNTRRFRSDLYYRLAVLEVTLPPLRERLEDIPVLVEAIAAGLDHAPAAVRDPSWVAALLKHPWPGNVRELRNHVERVAAGRFSQEASEIDTSVSLKEARNRWVQLFESQYLAELLRAHGGNVSAAARAAGVDRVHFYRLLDRAGLR